MHKSLFQVFMSEVFLCCGGSSRRQQCPGCDCKGTGGKRKSVYCVFVEISQIIQWPAKSRLPPKRADSLRVFRNLSDSSRDPLTTYSRVSGKVPWKRSGKTVPKDKNRNNAGRISSHLFNRHYPYGKYMRYDVKVRNNL